jgi:hypothetical protein
VWRRPPLTASQYTPAGELSALDRIEGGGLWNSETGTTTVTNTEIAGNTAPDGPQVYNDGGTFTIDGTPQPDDSP